MPYEEAVILHKVLTELHTGMLFLAFLAAAIAFACGRSWRHHVLTKGADATFVGAAVSGVAFLVLSAVSGLMAWPWERLWRTPMIYSKVSFAFLALVLWGIAIVARLSYGSKLWGQRRSAAVMAACSLFGLLAIIMTGSAGGHLGHGASLIDPLFAEFDPYVPMVWPLWLSAGILVSGSYFVLYLYLRKQTQPMTLFTRSLLVLLFLGAAGITKLVGSENTTQTQFAQTGHTHGEPIKKSPSDANETKNHMGHQQKTSPLSALKPAEGASVKIISPKPGQTFRSDQIPIQFRLVKGKRGHHVHAYIDNQLMGMFESEHGTLTGIRPGQHVLRLRVVADDHETELDASDQVGFVVK